MKKNLSIYLFIFLTLLLTSCGPKRSPVLDGNLVRETWMEKVDTNPERWAAGASDWFLNGGPSTMEPRYPILFPYMAPTTMSVTVPYFSTIQVVGDFKVQISGAYEPNSVYLYGPNNAVRSVIVQVKGGKLCLTQAKKAPSNVRDVVVRIGMNQINGLLQFGSGTIEGVKLSSSNLFITSKGSGNIYLSGSLNVTNVVAQAPGAVTVFGANSAGLCIVTMNYGRVNLSGDMNVNSIIHHGGGDINLIGAHSNNLTIYSDGSGKVGISGNDINLSRLTAKNFTCVFLYSINSNGVYVSTTNKARVGLAGSANHLYVDASNSSVFRGRDLCVRDAYVRACDRSHINVAGSSRVFATATQSGSIYFFGVPDTLTQFVSGSGLVIPVWGQSCLRRPIGYVEKVIERHVVTTKRVKKASPPPPPHRVRRKPVHHGIFRVRYRGEG